MSYTSLELSLHLYFLIFIFYFFHNPSVYEAALGIYSICSTSEQFNSSDKYESNLNELVDYFSYEIHPMRYVFGSKGYDEDQIQGFAYCEDVSNLECATCFTQASNEIRQKCPYSKVAMAWYEECQFKYSNNNFFGKIDNQTSFQMTNHENISNKLESFNTKKIELISNLANETSRTPKMYATGDLEVDGSIKLYGSTKCTKDLASYDCRKCLVGAILSLSHCCEWKQGARIHTESCSIRYEIYKFF